jgi:hypothetical protein
VPALLSVSFSFSVLCPRLCISVAVFRFPFRYPLVFLGVWYIDSPLMAECPCAVMRAARPVLCRFPPALRTLWFRVPCCLPFLDCTGVRVAYYYRALFACSVLSVLYRAVSCGHQVLGYG